MSLVFPSYTYDTAVHSSLSDNGSIAACVDAPELDPGPTLADSTGMNRTLLVCVFVCVCVCVCSHQILIKSKSNLTNQSLHIGLCKHQLSMSTASLLITERTFS